MVFRTFGLMCTKVRSDDPNIHSKPAQSGQVCAVSDVWAERQQEDLFMKRTNTHTRELTRVALLVAIELVMKLIGLGSVPVGPLYMSFLTLPIAVGAITMGPGVGALLGGVFGAVSFYDAITGGSAMTSALFQVSPVHTFILCVGMRMLMGACVGGIFRGLKKIDKSRSWSYLISAMCAPALNTLLFMGYIVLAFYNCSYVQNLVSVKGAADPLMFVVLLVGVQGVAEFVVSGILGGIVARAVAKYLK